MRAVTRGFSLTFCLLVSSFAYSQPQDQQPPAFDEDLTNILFLPQDVRDYAFGHVADLMPTRTVGVSEDVLMLNSKPHDWSEFRYEVNGVSYSLKDYFDRVASKGLIVVQGNDILLEYYAENHSEETRWISFSVSKSITSLLIGAAVKDGYIDNVDELVSDYLPRLKGTSYGDVRIRDVLNMASGVAWNEDYADPQSDVAVAGAYNGLQLVDYLEGLPKVAKPGTVFNYNTGETNLAGELLRSAIGNNASEYLEHKIWRPFGMEHDAYWLLSSEGGVETGGCCLNATLRDYARIGIFTLRDGVLSDGSRVLPEGWMTESLTPMSGFGRPGYEGYGYLWWLFDQGAYSARGIFQQWIFMDPEKELVIATHNNALHAVEDEDHQHTQAVIMAIRDAL
jgi:CubicO group peptidase (beta-lactamase class C family)